MRLLCLQTVLLQQQHGMPDALYKSCSSLLRNTESSRMSGVSVTVKLTPQETGLGCHN